MSTIVKIPAGECARVGYYASGDKLMFVITEKGESFYLYKSVNGGFERLGRAKEPPELVKKFGVNEAIRVL